MKKQLLTTALLSLVGSWGPANALPPTSTTTVAAIEAPVTPVPESSLPATPQPLPVVNCEYPIPATTAIAPGLLLEWAQKAAVQSFNFNPIDIDTQVEKLKSCFTDQGWQGFHDALDKSGNLAAIKSQNLTVSSEVDGTPTVTPVKENQWKVSLPMHVVYQNDKEKLTQLLTMDLLISRKVSGSLGIMQVIATPRNTAAGVVVPATTTSNE